MKHGGSGTSSSNLMRRILDDNASRVLKVGSHVTSIEKAKKNYDDYVQGGLEAAVIPSVTDDHKKANCDMARLAARLSTSKEGAITKVEDNLSVVELAVEQRVREQDEKLQKARKEAEEVALLKCQVKEHLKKIIEAEQQHAVKVSAQVAQYQFLTNYARQLNIFETDDDLSSN